MNRPSPMTEKVSDERLDELILWHEDFPLNQNGADTLAALRELREARKLLAEARPYLRHTSYCVERGDAVCHCKRDQLLSRIKALG